MRTYSRDGDKTETRTVSVVLLRLRNFSSPTDEEAGFIKTLVDSCGLPTVATFCAHAMENIYCGGYSMEDMICDLM